ncbi:hypothetical protein DES32_0627 [Methylovirgula ligni]|uniref:Uncharacterized protein n=2 Tax=Methylovirgula ligni TaxID=569860 RepID=A0A3D9ZD72_9HYPH|nr:hypothetical protein DES32_0627 [Methylovirgula ligni]
MQRKPHHGGLALHVRRLYNLHMPIFSRVLFLPLGLSLVLPVTAATADEQASPVPFQNRGAIGKIPSDVSVLAYGAAHPECLEWTDSCRTCLRSPDGRVGCSTPGIACQPKAVICKKEKSAK